MGKNIVIISSLLDKFGGYERIMANTINLLADKGENISLLLLAEGATSVYPLNSNVKKLHLTLNFGITQNGNIITRKIKMLRDLLEMKKALKKLDPDVLICSEYHYVVAGIISGKKKGRKIISWEHTHFNVNIKNRFWTTLCKYAYPKLDKIVCLNKNEKFFFEPINKNVVVIPNFVQPSVKTSELENKVILTVARLEPVKGIDKLLPVVKLVLEQHPGWQWKLIGDGKLKNEVISFIETEGLQNRLLLQQAVDQNITQEYLDASIYVMTSKNECFPMVLLEAMSYGLPCVAFDCDTGPRNIIIDQEDGLLIEKENIQKLAGAIGHLIENPALRKKMGKAAVENMKRFSPEKIYGLWKKLF